jgi:hypothetical protein
MGSKLVNRIDAGPAPKRTLPEPGSRPLLSLSGLGAALGHPAVAAILLVAILTKSVALFSVLRTRTHRWDFSLYYVSAMALRENLNPYTTELKPLGAKLGLEVGANYRTIDTPTFLLCFEPLTLLPAETAYWVWMGLSTLSLLAALFMLLRPAQSGLGGGGALAVGALLFLYPPVDAHFENAQSEFLVLLIFVLAMRLMDRGRDASAGLCLAVAGLLKAFPLLIFGYLAITRRWRTLCCAGLGLSGGALLTFALVGWQSLGFVRNIPWASRHAFVVLPENLSPVAFVSRLFWYAGGSDLGPMLDGIRRVATALTDLAVLAFTAKATLSASPGGTDPDWRAFSLWVIAAIMLSPIAWIHFLVLLIIPFSQFAAAAASARVSRRAVIMAVASYVLLVSSRWAGHRIASLAPFISALTECGSVSLIIAYLSVYWFVTDRVEPTGAVERMELASAASAGSSS